MKNLHASEFDNRQYMIHDNFEIHYYENNLLASVDVHKHNYYEIFFFVEGNVSMVIEDISYYLKPGNIILIPPKTNHYVINHDLDVPYRRFVLWLSLPYYRTIKNYSNELDFVFNLVRNKKQYIYSNDLMQSNMIQAKLFNLIEELHSYRYARETRIGISIYDLMVFLNRMAYENQEITTKQMQNRLHSNIAQYIENHISEELTLDSIADSFYVSKYYISHKFKEKYGISVHKYIIKKRLEMVCNALLNNENITDIFHQYGFKDYSSFYKAFKKEYGYSPKEYKEKNMMNA